MATFLNVKTLSTYLFIYLVLVPPCPEHHASEVALNNYWLMIVSYGGSSWHCEYMATKSAAVLISNQDYKTTFPLRLKENAWKMHTRNGRVELSRIEHLAI